MAENKSKFNVGHQIHEDLWMELSFPCCHRYAATRRVSAICEVAGHDHGHLREWSSDGVGLVPFPICSQAGYKMVIMELKRRCGFDNKTIETILALNLDEGLPEALTDEEAAIINDAAKLDQFFSYGLFGV